MSAITNDITEISNNIVKTNVINAYDSIAESFSHTRWNIWPSTNDFVQELETGSKVCEVGCGNAKNFVRDDIDWYGCDTSKELVRICNEKGFPNVTVCNGKQTEYLDNYFDAVMSVAVIHHIPTYNDRVNFIKEMIRITKSSEIKNNFMIQVWATDSKKFMSSDVSDAELDEYSANDRYVKFTNRDGNTSADRFYHFFDEEEFTKLINEFPELYGEIKHIKCNFIFIGRIL